MPGAREITREHGTTYYWGARLLPAESRRHVHAVYTLARLADDIVDLAGPDPGPETGRSPSTPSSAPSGTPSPPAASPDPVMAAVATTVRECGIDDECFARFFARDAHRPHPPHATRRGTTCSATWTAAPPSSAR